VALTLPALFADTAYYWALITLVTTFTIKPQRYSANEPDVGNLRATSCSWSF